MIPIADYFTNNNNNNNIFALSKSTIKTYFKDSNSNNLNVNEV